MTTEQRLERLERQNRRLKRGMIGMAVVGLSLLVMGQTLPPKVHDVVKAKEFEVVSDGGRTMLTLGSSRISEVYHTSIDGGDGFFKIFDSTGNLLIAITSDKNGEGRIYQFNRAGKPKDVWPPLR